MQTVSIHKYVDAVRKQTTESAEAAYVHRIALQRAVLKLHRFIATLLGDECPNTLDARLAEDGGIGSASNRMAAIAARICQPSEALDRRWANEWQTLRVALQSIESHFAEAPARLRTGR